MHVLSVFAMRFWYGMTVHAYPNVQSVIVTIVFCIEFTTSVIYMEEENHLEQLYICIEGLCADW